MSILFKAFWVEMIKSRRPFYYLKNMKRYFNIWIGWLQQAEGWEKALVNFDPAETIIYSCWFENQAMPFAIHKAQGQLALMDY